MKKKINLILIMLIVASTIFAVLETQYFGNNFFPGSPAELVCDLFSLLVVIGSIVVYNMVNASDCK